MTTEQCKMGVRVVALCRDPFHEKDEKGTIYEENSGAPYILWDKGNRSPECLHKLGLLEQELSYQIY